MRGGTEEFGQLRQELDTSKRGEGYDMQGRRGSPKELTLLKQSDLLASL